MTNSKRILITTESREIFIVRRRGAEIFQDFCADCQAEVEMLTLDAAIVLSGITAREIVRLAETGAIHFQETANGHLYICRQSLIKDFYADAN